MKTLCEDQMVHVAHRFLRMKKSHPKLYDYCMDDLGLQRVLEFMKMPTGRK